MSNENKTLVHRWFEEVWNAGRASAIDEMLTGDAVVHGLGPALRGPAEFKSFHSAYRNAFPDIAVHIDEIIAEGPLVAVRWSARATHLGDGLGFTATGKSVELNGMVFIRVERGKFVAGWNNFDQLGMLQQLGIVDVPLASSAPV